MGEEKAESKIFISAEVLKVAILIGSIIISIMLFYGAIDSRITTIETELPHKVSQEILFEKLDQLKKDLTNEIRLIETNLPKK